MQRTRRTAAGLEDGSVGERRKIKANRKEKWRIYVSNQFNQTSTKRIYQSFFITEVAIVTCLRFKYACVFQVTSPDIQT